MPSLVQSSASQSLVSCATTVDANTANPVTIIVRDANGDGIEGIPASAIVLAVSGTGNTVTQPTGYTNADGEISGAAFESSVSANKTVTVAVAGLTLDDQPVVAVGSAASVVFASEWTTATGITEAAFRDTSGAYPWPAYNGTLSNGAAEVVAADASLAGRGNYFRVNNAGENNLTVRHDTMVPASTTHWGRVYYRSEKTTNTHNHWIAIGGLATGGDIEVAWGSTGTGSGDVVRFGGFNQEDGTDVPYPYTRFAPGNVDNAGAPDYLTTGDWYLLEWQVQYTDTDTFHLFVWVSEVDSNGDVTTADKWTASTFYRQDYAGQANTDLAAIQAAEPYFGLSSGGGTAGARQYVLGNEGPGGGLTDSGYFLLASFAVSTTGRITDSDVTP